MAVLSNGRARDADTPGYVAPSPGTSFGRSSSAPASYLAAHGGSLPVPAGCPSTGSLARDSVLLRLTFSVPTNATALAFDWLFATADYPAWVCTQFTDYFLALVDGSSVFLPPDGNVALDSIAGNPVNASFQAPVMELCDGCPGGTGPLAGTGYENLGATGWHTSTVPVVGGETLTLDLLVFDVGDPSEDSLILVDDLRWVTQ
jgi:hypothetical protein